MASYTLNLSPAAESLPRHSYERIRLEKRCDVSVGDLLNHRGLDDCRFRVRNLRGLGGFCLLLRTGGPAASLASCLCRYNLISLGGMQFDRLGLRIAKIRQPGIESQCVDHFLDRRLWRNEISNSCQVGFTLRREVYPLRLNRQGRISSEEVEKMDQRIERGNGGSSQQCGRAGLQPCATAGSCDPNCAEDLEKDPST